MRVDAPRWRSHTPRNEIAGRCTCMVKPPGFFFLLWNKCAPTLRWSENVVLVGMLHDKRKRFKLNKERQAGAPVW